MAHVLSVIIPHYNNPNGLSMLLQTIPYDESIQVIVVDDCSTRELDQYETLKEKYENKGVIFLQNLKNSGAGAARNKGMANADGEWLLFADSDDYFTKGAFDTIFEQTTRNEDIVFFPPTSVYLNTGTKSDRHINYEKMIYDYLGSKDDLWIRFSWASPCSKIIRRSTIVNNNVAFDEVPVSNDVMFSVKSAFYANEVGVSDNVIYVITCNSESLTNKKNLERFKIRVDTWTERYMFLKQRIETDEFERLGYNLNGWMSMALFRGYGISAVWYIIRKIIVYRIPVIKYLSFGRIIKSMTNQTRLLIKNRFFWR